MRRHSWYTFEVRLSNIVRTYQLMVNPFQLFCSPGSSLLLRRHPLPLRTPNLKLKFRNDYTSISFPTSFQIPIEAVIENVATYTQRHPHAFTLFATVIFSSLGDDGNESPGLYLLLAQWSSTISTASSITLSLGSPRMAKTMTQGILGPRSTTLYTGRLASPTFPSLLVVSNIEKHLSTHSSAVKGSQAYVYGTISINNSTGVPDPSWVASGASPPFGYIENNPVG